MWLRELLGVFIIEDPFASLFLLSFSWIQNTRKQLSWGLNIVDFNLAFTSGTFLFLVLEGHFGGCQANTN